MVWLEKESGTGSKLLLQSEQRMRLLNKCLLLTDTLSNLSGLTVCPLHAYSVPHSLLESVEGVSLISGLLSCFRAEVWPWVKRKAQTLTSQQACHLPQSSTPVLEATFFPCSCSSPTEAGQDNDGSPVASSEGQSPANAAHQSWKWCISRLQASRVGNFRRVNTAVKRRKIVLLTMQRIPSSSFNLVFWIGHICIHWLVAFRIANAPLSSPCFIKWLDSLQALLTLASTPEIPRPIDPAILFPSLGSPSTMVFHCKFLLLWEDRVSEIAYLCTCVHGHYVQHAHSGIGKEGGESLLSLV